MDLGNLCKETEWSMWAYKSRMASWRKQNINQMMKAEYKLSKKRQRGPEERPQCQGRVCVGQQRMSGTMKISRIVEQLESLAEQFRHYYTLGNREPWRLLSERVTNDMPNNWSTEWIERREINNTDTQFWGVSWVWRGEGEWKLTQRKVRQMLSQLPTGRSDLRTLLNSIHEVVIRLNEVKWSTNSFMLVNVFMEWDRDSKVPPFL